MGFTRLENLPKKEAEPTGDAPQGKKVKGRKKAQFVQAQVAVHDRTQLETVFDYPLLPRDKFERRRLRYEVEAFLFFPRQMGITPQTYPKEKFYHDLRPLIRLREPRLAYKQLIGISEEGKRSPIAVIREYLEMLRSGGEPAPERTVVDEARLFACSFVSYYLRRIERRTKKIKKLYRAKAAASESTQELNDQFIDALTKAAELLSKSFTMMREWRRMLSEAESLPDDVAANLRTEARFVDEYCAYRFRDGLAKMIRSLNSIDSGVAGPEFDRFHRKLTAYSRLEHWYSNRVGYAWVDRGSPETEVEHYVFRRGALKRRVWRVLYLDVRTRPLFAFQQQLGAMIAAGLAAFWAVAAEFFIRSRASFGPTNSGLESGTFLLITAFILAYVLKDRIKELGRSYFKVGPFARVPDNSETIYFTTAGGERWPIGNIYEYTKFLSAAKIPEAVKALRSKADPDGIESEDEPEEIIRYRKVIHLHPSILKRYFYPIRAVHDILRLNVHAFLSKLDDPEQAAEILDPSGRVIEMKMPKVYHLDVVLKYSKITQAVTDTVAIYDHIRLVVNKKGLYRIERLS